MQTRNARVTFALLTALASTLVACSTPPADRLARAAYDEANDPIEPFNRAMWTFNRGFDEHFFRPLAEGYRTVVPEPGRDALRNFLRNLRSPLILAHDLLQGEPSRAAVTLQRFLVNSTVGFAGMLDVADMAIGLQFHDEDFGQTMAVWGAGEGPYLVLPLLGPSGARDAGGLVIDNVIDPVSLAMNVYGIGYGPFARQALSALDLRARNIETLDDIERTSIDFYATARSLYRQRRAEDIANGRKAAQRDAPQPLEDGDIVPSMAPGPAEGQLDPAAVVPSGPAIPPTSTPSVPYDGAQPLGTIVFQPGSLGITREDRALLWRAAMAARQFGARIVLTGRVAEDDLGGDTVHKRIAGLDAGWTLASVAANELWRQGLPWDRIVVVAENASRADPGGAASAAMRRVNVYLR